MATKLCMKCGKMMDEDTQFYTHKDGSKTDMCKKCLTMHIDNFDPQTFLWLLEEMDVPYVPEEWNVLRDRAFAKNPNLTGMSVFGKYLSKMKLKQWKDYKWEDSERIQALNREKKEVQEKERKLYDAEIQEKFNNGEISESQYKTLMSTEEQNKELLYANPATPTQPGGNPFSDPSAFMENTEMKKMVDQLTEEDKIKLMMKWGDLYKPSEWIELEKNYTEMTESFDIQDADTINTLVLLCKTNLKMNQAIDLGDVEGFQKLSKVSESLRKSAKFTAAQNKEEKNDYVDSVGELVAMCEREGFIPRFATDIPQDKVDLTLKDMNNYVNKLVTQDLGFGQQIEDALKKIQIQQEMNTSETDILEDDADASELIDQDYQEFYESVNDQKEQDAEILKGAE